MDPREFQNLALRLAATGHAAECRGAISRSYYAAFNVAAQHLRSMSFRIGKGAAVHGEVRHCLANSGISEMTVVADLIAGLQARRIRADYQLDQMDAESKGSADSVSATAAGVISQLDSAFSGPDRASIQSAIAAWRRANGYP